MPSYTEVYPEKWLKPITIQGKRLRVTVESLQMVQLRNPKTNRTEPNLVCKFVGKHAALVLNKTRCRAFHKITGTDDYTQWVGATVIISVGIAPNDEETIVISPASEGAAATTTH